MTIARLVRILTLSLLVIGLGLRLWHITGIPLGYYYDELDHVFTGEAVARFGTDIAGTWSPLTLTPLHSANLMAELPALIHAGFQKIIGFGPTTGHLPNAIFGLGVIALTMAITHKLFNRPLLSLVVGAMVAVNPWHIHLSRTAYEAPMSLFFQLLALYGLLGLRARFRLYPLFLSLIGIFMAFFTYHGAKITVPILTIALVGYQLLSSPHRRLTLARYGLPLLLCLGLVGNYFRLAASGTYGNRPGEIISSNYLSGLVNDRRRLSLDFWGKDLAINKFSIGAEEVLRRYLFVFDPFRLFGTGMENTFQFSLFVHPYFYVSGLPLLALGTIYLWRFYRRQAYLILLLLLPPRDTNLTPIGFQATFRSSLTYILLLIVVGVGSFSLITNLRHRLTIIGVFAVFGLEVLLFAANYFGRYPIISADNHHFFERLLAAYLSRTDPPVTVVTSTPFITARSLTSYLSLMPALSITQRQQFASPSSDTFTLGHELIVSSLCPETQSGVTIYDPDKYAECRPSPTPPRISLGSPIDSRSYYYLVSAALCPISTLPPYVYVSSPQLYDIFRLSDVQFCSTWIQKN